MAKALNIEIGDKIVRVCVASKKGKGGQVLDCFRFATPSDAVSDGVISEHEIMADLLKSKLEKKGYSKIKNVTFVLSSTRIASREVLLPPVKEKRLKAVVEANAQEYFPIDLAGYKVSHCILENVKEPEPGTRVLITAVPVSTLLSYVKFANIAGLTLVGYDYTANSQYQLLSKLPIPGVEMCANIGTNQTIITFMQEGKLMLVRTFPFGGDDTMHELVSGTEFAEADFIKILDVCEDEEWINANVDAETKQEAFARLVNGISRSADVFKSSFKGLAVDKIIIMGACSGVCGICEAINQEMNVETRLLKEIEGIEKFAKPELVNFYVGVIGATIAPLDLIPDELKQKKVTTGSKANGRDSIATGLALLIVATLVGGYYAISSTLDLKAKEDRLEELNAEIEELSYVEETYGTFLQYQAIEANLKIIEQYGENNNAQLRGFIEELEKAMPSSLLAMSATCTNDGISMSVQVADMEDAAVTISQLRKFESISNISVDSISEITDDLGIGLTEFTISAAYKPLEEITVPETGLLAQNSTEE